MSHKHTEGPWIVEAGMVFGTQGKQPRICTPCSQEYEGDDSISGHQDMYEAAANAKLIAAAPEMLEALEGLLKDKRIKDGDHLTPSEAYAMKIIKKASW